MQLPTLSACLLTVPVNAMPTSTHGDNMPASPLIVLAALIGACGYIAYRIERQRLPKKRARFATREPLGLNEIYERFYATSGLSQQRVLELWAKVAKTMQLDPEKLRPEDSFDTELAPVKGFPTPDELNDLTDFYKDEWRRLGHTENPPKLKTLDELIRALATECRATAR